ncbi:MAG: putative ABC transporter permease [Clostridia bacterium]|nr:putative ABC transporter permease [Clostridia bacterium]
MQELKRNKSKIDLSKFGFIAWCFLICSFAGWVYELCWQFSVGNGYVNRGFLHGCYLPVYGFGGLGMYFLLWKTVSCKKKTWQKILTPIFVYIAAVLITTTVELLASYLVEYVFRIEKLWDYTYEKYNFEGRISLKNSLYFGIGGMVFLYGIIPVLKKTVGKMSAKALTISGLVITGVMSADLIVQLIMLAIK